MAKQPTYPYQDGPHTVLGPEIFTSEDRSTIVWEGANYIPADKITEYLDECITVWRSRRDGQLKDDAHGMKLKSEMGDSHFRNMCVYYIDAFQSTRLSLVGAAL